VRGFTAEQADAIARTIGIGAVKYFDLSHAPTSAYRFDFDSVLSLDGTTAPYMLYAYARIRSIGRKAGVEYADIPAETRIVLEHESELRLAKLLLRFPELIEQVGRELRPNVLTDYLFELSKRFSLFYDRKHGVRVIDAEPATLRLSRLRLCDLTARTLKLGLWLLGIGTVERM
jgi:arginyl-tRNA synthetase